LLYSAVRRWSEDGIAEEIKRELRAEAHVAVSRRSGLFLLLVRSALPRLDAKRASKWASALEFADHQGIRSKRLRAFLKNSGGIEGAARARAKHLKQVLGDDQGSRGRPTSWRAGHKMKFDRAAEVARYLLEADPLLDDDHDVLRFFAVAGPGSRKTKHSGAVRSPRK